MKLQLRAENVSDRTVTLDWLSTSYDLKPGEDKVVELSETDLYRKSRKSSDAHERLNSLLDRKLISLVVITDQLTQNLAGEDNEPVGGGTPSGSKHKSTQSGMTKEQEMVAQAAEEASDPVKKDSRFRAVKTENAEDADRISPTPGTERSGDDNVMDLEGKPLNQAHREREQQESLQENINAGEKVSGRSSTEEESAETSGTESSGTKKSSSGKSTKSTSSKSGSTKSTSKKSKSTKKTSTASKKSDTESSESPEQTYSENS